jgi:hypothetical protein
MKMFTKILRLLPVFLVAGSLGACETPVASPGFPELTFTHLVPVSFKAGSVEIVDNYIAPLKSPNLDHEFPVIPEAALQRWTIDRINANDGTLRKVRMIIQEASALGIPLKTKDGIKGLFYKEQAFRIEATLEATLEVRNDRDFVSSTARAKVQRSRTVPEETSPAALDKIYFRLLEDLMRDFDQRMELEIRKHMTRDLY